ncbi:MAG: energy transducer TonB [Vicinamibacterales bacterium]
MEPVTEILQARARPVGGMESMLMLSLVAHGAVLAALVLAAPSWRGTQTAPREVMQISLSGGVGPQTGGLTPIAGRPVQQALDTPPRAPIRPPAASEPEMTAPAPNVRAKPPVQNPVNTRGRTPTTGPEVTTGSAVAETGAKGAGFGLSSPGGQGTGAQLDVGNFCCPEYLSTMQQLIKRNWNEKQPNGGEVMVKFTIQRTGAITEIVLEKSSGYAALDLESQRALSLTKQLPPLPAQFPDSTLTVHLSFQYQR